MQITEKDRSDIALSIPQLGTDDADKIAETCRVSRDTVYRTWRKIRGKEKGTVHDTDPVFLALGELAVKRNKEAKENHKRLAVIRKQLSEVKAA